MSAPDPSPSRSAKLRPVDAFRYDAFRCEVQPERTLARVLVAGDVDLSTAPRVDATLRELCDAGWKRIVVDLAEVSFLDSTGVHVLVGWADAARDDGIALSIVPGPPSVQRIFALTGVLDRLPFATEA